MSADDQAFLDILSSIPVDLRRYSGDVADYIDRHVETISDRLREALAASRWVPDSIRPRPPPPAAPALALPGSALDRLQDWAWRHKILTASVVLATGTVLYRTYRSSRLGRKHRRARRARSGGRLDVVVIAGSPSLPLTRSLALDMERKGFVVFVVCSAAEDELAVRNLSRADIKPLSIDITDPPSAGASIDRFAQFLQAPHSAVPGAKQHRLSLRAVVLIPSLDYQTSPIATIPPSSFADLFNTHLLHPILTIQAFLPLLTSRLAPEKPPAKVLVFTPSIISSINPPFHAPEATVCSALSAFTEVLTAELRPLSIPVTHVQLGALDFASFTPGDRNHSQQNSPPAGLLPAASQNAETLAWPEPARHAYGRNFVSQSASALGAGRIRGLRGSSLRDLHNAVFDVIDGPADVGTAGVVRVGLGAGVYGFVGRWVPRPLVSWMMGIRRVDDLAAWQPVPPESLSLSTSSHSSTYGSSPRSDAVGGSHDFVSVPLEHVGDSHVWKEG